MKILLTIIIDLFFATGGFFALAGVIGIIRMPDSYCRMQSSTNTATLGTICVLIGVSLYGFFILNSVAIGVKPIVISLFILFSNPVASHSIAKAAKKCGVFMLNKSRVDEYGRDNPQ
ncbi:MAG: monovalent cation/H(+) antiporter subunit G [Clostridiales bacterium]|nr:monovalent cation/H(+) antiporter subunit G [Clostridiales bacterium]HBM81865.1 sodium:proton antiporter [Clostridiaceae bacterium]